MTERLTEDADFGKKKIIFSDETHFDPGGYLNKQYCRIWGTGNPHAYIEKPTHPKRVTVLKIALSAAEPKSFGHLGAAICHRWTIICGVPSKIIVTLTL